MTEKNTHYTPTEINLHRKSRVLEIAFSDGTRFDLPCEYLRVFSPSAEVRVMDQPVHGKETVNISQIEPMGSYALRLHFDDGHDTGVYSWSTLHALGVNYERNWQDYLRKLNEHGVKRNRQEAARAQGKTKIKLLYFIQLAAVSGQDQEDIALPEPVTNVRSLLAWLRDRGDDWNKAFADDRVRVTVNKQFAEPDTSLEDGDEVALVPKEY
jgi:DUF971 family protein/molybdopterin converting factor small subunit